MSARASVSRARPTKVNVMGDYATCAKMSSSRRHRMTAGDSSKSAHAKFISFQFGSAQAPAPLHSVRGDRDRIRHLKMNRTYCYASSLLRAAAATTNRMLYDWVSNKHGHICSGNTTQETSTIFGGEDHDSVSVALGSSAHLSIMLRLLLFCECVCMYVLRALICVGVLRKKSHSALLGVWDLLRRRRHRRHR